MVTIATTRASATAADALAENEHAYRFSRYILAFLLEELGSHELIITGIAADSCVAITAHDAHVRKFKLWVPSDCVASEKPEYKRNALAHLRRVAKASTKASTSR
jgi:nicotinamidase-related amidase